LLGLSFVKAALIIGYFMHLKYEVSKDEVAYHVFGDRLSYFDDHLSFFRMLGVLLNWE